MLLGTQANRSMAYADARSAIIELGENGDFEWETIAREMIAQMSGDEAKEFFEYFESVYMD